MIGTTGDIVPIVIVPIVALAFWLVMMYHADSSPGPVVPGQRPGTGADEVTPAQARASETRS